MQGIALTLQFVADSVAAVERTPRHLPASFPLLLAQVIRNRGEGLDTSIQRFRMPVMAMRLLCIVETNNERGL